MKQQKSKRKNDKAQVYYPAGRRLSIAVFLLALLVTFITVGIALQAPAAFDNLGILYPALFTALAWFIGQVIFYNKLIFREDGLEVYHYGRHLFIAWQDVDRLDWLSSEGLAYWGLHYRKADRDAVSLLGMYFSQRPNFIPLQQYIERLSLPTGASPLRDERYRQSAIVQMLLQYAPHLTQQKKSKRTGHTVFDQSEFDEQSPVKQKAMHDERG